MKRHIGTLKSGNRVIVVFMQLPDDPDFCLVVESDSLPDPLQYELGQLVTSPDAQNSRSLHEILYKRMFMGGKSFLETLHEMRKLNKVKTTEVLMTPDNNTQIPLDELINMMRKVTEKTEHISDEELQENRNQYKKRVEDKEESDKVSIGKRLLREADDMEQEANALKLYANKKREDAKQYLPEPKPKTPRKNAKAKNNEQNE